MAMKINKLEIENVKRVKAVKIEPTANGLTIIGGNNNQGKTSVLDAIAWALGGDKYRPSQAQREGSAIPPNLHIVMNNGLVVERKGKNSTLKVTDPQGQKAGQQLLNEFVEQLALDLPKFMESSGKEKAQTEKRRQIRCYISSEATQNSQIWKNRKRSCSIPDRHLDGSQTRKRSMQKSSLIIRMSRQSRSQQRN